MNKTVTAFSSVTNILLSVELFVAAGYLIMRFIASVGSIIDSAKENEALAVLIFIFFAIIFSVVGILFIGGLICAGFGIFCFVSGIKKLNGIRKNLPAKIKSYSMTLSVIGSVVATVAALGIAVTLGIEERLKYIPIACAVLCATALIGVTFDAVSAAATKSN